MKATDEKDSIVRILDRLELWMFISTLLVVVGLIIEYTPDFFDIPACVVKWTHKLAGVLITVGVAGELFIGRKAARRETRLREINDSTIATLNGETERLREENIKTLILRSSRSLGNLTAFKQAMRPYSGTKFVLQGTSNLSEISQLMSEFLYALPQAGWVPIAGPVANFQMEVGINVLSASRPGDPNISAATLALADWINGREIATLFWSKQTEDLEPATVIIEVGCRPESLAQHEELRTEYARRHARFQPVTPPQA